MVKYLGLYVYHGSYLTIVPRNSNQDQIILVRILAYLDFCVDDGSYEPWSPVINQGRIISLKILAYLGFCLDDGSLLPWCHVMFVFV